MGRRTVIFGASLGGERAFERLKKSCRILAFVDNDASKQGKSLHGIPVVAPRELRNLQWDVVVVASGFAREICEQLESMGVDSARVELDASPPDLAVHAEWKRLYASELGLYRDRHAGEDCFIIGNGPSLRDTDVAALSDYHTFGLNKIHLLREKTGFCPSYHAAVNPLVIEQCASDFESLPCPSFLSYAPARNRVKEWKGEGIHYIYTCMSHAFSRDISDTVCEGVTVTYVAMQLAWYMGFENVFLVGVDHRFQAEGEPNEMQVMGGEDPNHFDPSYFANQAWQLPDLPGSEFSYRIAKKAFEDSTPPRRIFDATIGGALTVYPKIGFAEALKQCRRK